MTRALLLKSTRCTHFKGIIPAEVNHQRVKGTTKSFTFTRCSLQFHIHLVKGALLMECCACFYLSFNQISLYLI